MDTAAGERALCRPVVARFRAQDYPLTLAKKRVLKAIREPLADDALALKFLERRQRERYSLKVTVEHQGGVALTYGDLEGKRAANPADAEALATHGEVAADWPADDE